MWEWIFKEAAKSQRCFYIWKGICQHMLFLCMRLGMDTNVCSTLTSRSSPIKGEGHTFIGWLGVTNWVVLNQKSQQTQHETIELYMEEKIHWSRVSQPEWLQWAMCAINESFMNGVNVLRTVTLRWYLAYFTVWAPSEKVCEWGNRPSPDTTLYLWREEICRSQFP